MHSILFLTIFNTHFCQAGQLSTYLSVTYPGVGKGINIKLSSSSRVLIVILSVPVQNSTTSTFYLLLRNLIFLLPL